MDNQELLKLYQDALQKCIILEKELDELKKTIKNKNNNKKQYIKKNIELTTVNNLHIVSINNEINTTFNIPKIVPAWKLDQNNLDNSNVNKNNIFKEEQSSRLLNFNKYKEYMNKKDNSNIVEELNIKNNIDDNKIKMEKIIKNIKVYDLKIYIKNIPIFVEIEYHSYEPLNTDKNQIVPYFDISKYYSNILLFFNRYNVSFNNNQNTTKNKKTNITNKNNNLTDKERIKKWIPIKPFKGVNNEVLKLIAGEHAANIRYQSIINKKINDNNLFEDALAFSVKNKEITRQTKHILKRKYERCHVLHDTFGEKLNRFKFGMYRFCQIPDDEFKIWLEYLKEEIDKEYPNIDICNHIIKQGPMTGIKCGKINCNNDKHL